MTKSILATLIAAATLAAACGGTTVVSPGSTSAGAGATSTGSGTMTSGTNTSGTNTSGTGTSGTATTSGTASGGTGGAPNLGCPASAPSGSCASYPAGLSCTYGDSVQPSCRDSVVCENGGWEEMTPTCVAPTNCPSTQPATGEACPLQSGSECVYGNTICDCDCGGPACSPPPWTCAAPPASPCPTLAPNDGTTCNDPGLQCTYGNPCSGGAEADCTDGFWRWQRDIPCPV